MSKIKIIVIDDEPKSVESILFVLNKYCQDIEIIGSSLSASEGINLIEVNNPDIIFLDVEMPYENGFDLLNKFIDRTFEVIFVTAYENYAHKAFKSNAIDYILKPFTSNDIVNAFNKAKTNILNKKKINNASQFHSSRLAVPVFDGLNFINIDDIIKCEADGNYTNFYLLDNKKHLVSKSIADYEDILAPYGFHRVHQSFLINLKHVSKYVKGRGGYVVMVDNTLVDVSVRKKIEFLEKIFM